MPNDLDNYPPFTSSNEGSNGVVALYYKVKIERVTEIPTPYIPGGVISQFEVEGETWFRQAFYNPEIQTEFEIKEPVQIQYIIVGGGSGCMGGRGGESGFTLSDVSIFKPGKYSIVVGKGGKPYQNGGYSQIVGLTQKVSGGVLPIIN